MGKLIMIILGLCLCGFIWALPVWFVINFFCFAFNIAFHLTVFQAFAICLIIEIIRNFIFKKEDNE